MAGSASKTAKWPRWAPFCVYAVFHAVLAFSVWRGSWAADRSFVQPDHSMVFPAGKAAKFLRETLEGGAFTPLDLHWFLGSPYCWATFEYALPCFLAGLALAWYLLGRGLSRLSAFGAALAFSFAGYSTTLFSAGHLGWFEFVAFGVFVFGLIDRALRGGSFRHWALLGGTLAWGAARQSDMWMLFTALAAAYGGWGIVRELRIAPPGSGLRSPRSAARLAAGLALAAAVCALVGFPQFRHALGEDLAVRDGQIAASGASGGGEARWEFATNWSMPPEDTLEFAAPEVRGGSSDPRVSPELPYRGRLGRPADSKFVAGRTMPNYRQHSLYLGAITVALALIAFVALFRRRDEDARFLDLPFWCAAAGLCWILSMGRYTPVYRVFYALPFMDYLRAPVKFHHLVELAAAALAGYGIEALRGRVIAGKLRAAALAAVWSLAGSLAVAAAWFALSRPALESGICALGFGADRAAALAAAASLACCRGALIAALAAAAAWFATRGKTGARAAIAALAALVAVNAIDLAAVDHRYLAVQDISFQRAPSPIAADVLAAGGGCVANPMGAFPALGESLLANGIDETVADPADPSARFALLPSAAAKERPASELLARRGAKAIGSYTVGRRGFLRARPGESAQLELFRFNDAAPRPAPRPKSAASIASAAATLALLALLAAGFAGKRGRVEA